MSCCHGNQAAFLLFLYFITLLWSDQQLLLGSRTLMAVCLLTYWPVSKWACCPCWNSTSWSGLKMRDNLLSHLYSFNFLSIHCKQSSASSFLFFRLWSSMVFFFFYYSDKIKIVMSYLSTLLSVFLLKCIFFFSLYIVFYSLLLV